MSWIDVGMVAYLASFVSCHAHHGFGMDYGLYGDKLIVVDKELKIPLPPSEVSSSRWSSG